MMTNQVAPADEASSLSQWLWPTCIPPVDSRAGRRAWTRRGQIAVRRGRRGDVPRNLSGGKDRIRTPSQPCSQWPRSRRIHGSAMLERLLTARVPKRRLSEPGQALSTRPAAPVSVADRQGDRVRGSRRTPGRPRTPASPTYPEPDRSLRGVEPGQACLEHRQVQGFNHQTVRRQYSLGRRRSGVTWHGGTQDHDDVVAVRVDLAPWRGRLGRHQLAGEARPSAAAAGPGRDGSPNTGASSVQRSVWSRPGYPMKRSDGNARVVVGLGAGQPDPADASAERARCSGCAHRRRDPVWT